MWCLLRSFPRENSCRVFRTVRHKLLPNPSNRLTSEPRLGPVAVVKRLISKSTKHIDFSDIACQ
jgi:hypothetical protein